MIEPAPRLLCEKCGRSRRAADFYKTKKNGLFPVCKDCLTQYIDNKDPETFKWILQKFDVPYIEAKWNNLASITYQKDPANFNSKSVLGRYLRSMNMTQYADYTYADSDKLNNITTTSRDETFSEEETEEKLKAQLENGEISKAEYLTLSPFTVSSAIEEKLQDFPSTSSPLLETGSPQDYLQKYNEQIKTNMTPPSPPPIDYMDLTEEEIQYLLLKWGSLYSPQQWLAMETMYQKYAADYEITVDREEVLKTMCKTSVKMNEALDTGDISSFKNLAAVFDQLRKSAKFTEAQKKEETVRYLDSIGELVAFCEKEQDIIEQFPLDPVKNPQDRIDFILKDLKSYTYNLVTNELGLGDLIESYIEKLEKAQKDGERSLEEGLITSSEEEQANELTDEEAESFQGFLENQIEQDADELFKMLGMES